jgi:pimeloyl-ACP methyl ester carboxylesterase
MGAASNIRRLGFAVCVAVLAAVSAGALAGGAHAAPGAAPRVPSIDWEPCGSGYRGIKCGTAKVPLDYDRPRGAKTKIALARIPASASSRKGSVFVNPGGPGGSGVGLVLDGFGAFLHENLNGRFDVIGFDPRGVGASDPLHCFDNEDDLVEFLVATPLFPYEPGQFRPFFAHWKSLADTCLTRGERIAAHMSTADVVRDLNLLRKAVGDRKLTYLGFSYGSYIGTTYANLFPRRIRALVIDGVLNPRLWSSGLQIKSDRVATQAVFEEFLRLCEEAGPDCAFSDGDDTAKRWRILARSLKDEPVDLGDGFIYTYDFLIGDAAGAMYAPDSWGGPEGYATFLDLVADAALGDQSAAREARAVRRHLIEELAGKAEPDYDNGLDAYFGNQCADTQYPSEFWVFRLVGIYARLGSRFGPYWWWFNNGCADWPVARDRYAGPWSTSTSAPVLVVGNHFDPATDYAGAQAANRFLEDSRLLTYAGWGHTAYGISPCATEHVDAYLLNRSLPPVGTVCPANPNPFLPAAARVAARGGPMVARPPEWLLRPEPGSR